MQRNLEHPSQAPAQAQAQAAKQAAIFSLIGNTPLAQVTRLDTGPCQLFLKLESQNPGGSIKDRIGVAMIARSPGWTAPARSP